MAQCQGTTKAGDRCKRDANQGSDYCGFHAGQGSDSEEAPETSSDKRPVDLLLIGVVALGLLALRRVIRF